MRYHVLRNCYVNDRYYSKGEVKELPEDMWKSEKNFKPVSDAPESVTSPENGLVCPICGKECKSKFGLQSHTRIHTKGA